MMGTKSVDVKGESITEYVTCQGVHYKEMSSIYLESGYDFISIRDYPMMKLGCAGLVHTFSFTQGGLSQRQMICHVNQLGTVPNFNLWLSSCILGEHGLRAIEHNMDNLFGNPEFTRFLPSDGKWMATLIIDGVALDEKFNLDDSQIPHQITGGCRHCIDTTFNTFEDAQRFQEGLESGIHHRAIEMEVFAIGFNHPTFTSLIPVCLSRTCKTDDIVGESTDTIYEIVSTIERKWHSFAITNQFKMSTYNSDGAPQFRKGVGKVLSKDLPPKIRSIYIAPDK